MASSAELGIVEWFLDLAVNVVSLQELDHANGLAPATWSGTTGPQGLRDEIIGGT